MKIINLKLLPLLVFAFACNSEQKRTSVVNSTVKKDNEIKAMIPTQTCYLGVIGKDSIFLKVEQFPNEVKGALAYKFYEKDKSNGEIDGKMNGDTLVAYYTFKSEGIRSVRQVAFLLQEGEAKEGTGDMEEKEGKMNFKNLNKLNFNNTFNLKKSTCLN